MVKQTVLHILASDEPGGDAQQVALLAERLTDWHVVTRALPKRWQPNGLTRWQVWRWIREIQPQVVHFWSEACFTGGIPAAQHAGVRVVATLRHVDPWRRPNLKTLKALSHVFVNQPGLQKHYGHDWPILPDGVPEYTPRASREALGLPADALLVACVGPLRTWKRWKWAIWSIDSIVRLYPNAHLLFIGDGDSENLLFPPRTKLEIFARQYERSDIVHFLGNRPDVREILPHCALFWSPQSVPGAGLAMLEAMAAGVPVVTTEAVWLPENLAEHVPVSRETLGIAAASHRLLTNPERTAEITRSARQWIAEYHSAEKMVQAYAEVYAR